METVGSVRRGVTAQEKELGRGGVGCRVRKEWDWGVETRGFLHLGGDPGAPIGAKWVPEEDSPKSRWGPRTQ